MLELLITKQLFLLTIQKGITVDALLRKKIKIGSTPPEHCLPPLFESFGCSSTQHCCVELLFLAPHGVKMLNQ
jgi:hypothetical protein